MPSLKPLAALLAVVALLWGAAAIGVWHAFSNLGERGSFGDMFGGVNALFSGLAFAGILFALHLQRQELVVQREELRAQREELRLTREELSRTAAAQEASQDALGRQAVLMQSTARLNALRSLIDGCATKISLTPVAFERSALQARQVELIGELEAELAKLEEWA